MSDPIAQNIVSFQLRGNCAISPLVGMDFKTPMACTSRTMVTRTVHVHGFKGSVRNQSRPETAYHSTFVVVQREWNGWRTGMALLNDLHDIHWHQPPGAPRPLIHAYLSCSQLQSGNLPHDCEQRSAPHQLLVCLLKSHTAPWVFEDLARRASDAGMLRGISHGRENLRPD